MIKTRKKYAVVVLSHASYSDLWPMLFQSYERYFNCSLFDYYLATDDKLDEVTGIFSPIKYPKELSWGGGLKDIVGQLDYEKVIFTFDDLILSAEVDCVDLVSYAENTKYDYDKLICSHVRFYERFLKCGKNFELSCNDSYRGSLVFALVNKKFMSFLSSLDINELSPWGYERNINSILNSSVRLSGVRKNFFKFHNLVIKGKINPIEKKRLSELEGWKYSGSRELMGSEDVFSYYMKLVVFTIIKYFIPYGFFNYLRKIKQRYVAVK